MSVTVAAPAPAAHQYYCANCGRDPGTDAARVDPEWAFCRYCGYHLTAVAAFVYAGFWIRVCAYLIDAAILAAALILPIVVVQLATTATSATVLDLAVTMAYFSVGNGTGGTLGRRSLGLRVVNEAGNAPGIRAGVSLFLLSVISRLVFGIGYLVMIRDKHKQTWHDKLSGTYVIRTR
ncbi:MAG: RDD family protein [Chloroflexi bacterium]|nr:RDD family protein [Chloroflexota bacterium]